MSPAILQKLLHAKLESKCTPWSMGTHSILTTTSASLLGANQNVSCLRIQWQLCTGPSSCQSPPVESRSCRSYDSHHHCAPSCQESTHQDSWRPWPCFFKLASDLASSSFFSELEQRTDDGDDEQTKGLPKRVCCRKSGGSKLEGLYNMCIQNNHTQIITLYRGSRHPRPKTLQIPQNIF